MYIMNFFKILHDNDFFNLIGEHFTESELVDYLMTLVSTGQSEADRDVPLDPAKLLQQIPEFVTAKDFVEEMLGLSATYNNN